MAPSMKPRHTTLTKPSTRGGRKRKIPIEKIVDKAATAVTYSKRTGGLYSKASQLCLLDSSQIAIIATPPSSDSNLSFYSFAHHSADALVSAYLSGQSLGPVPSDTAKQMREDVAICLARKDLGLGFWWEEDLPDTPQSLSQSWNSMRNLMTNLEGFCGELAIDHQTLTSHSDPICCVPRDHHQTQVPDQTLILDCLTNKDTELIDPQQQNQAKLIYLLLPTPTTLQTMKLYQTRMGGAVIKRWMPAYSVMPLPTLMARIIRLQTMIKSWVLKPFIAYFTITWFLTTLIKTFLLMMRSP